MQSPSVDGAAKPGHVAVEIRLESRHSFAARDLVAQIAPCGFVALGDADMAFDSEDEVSVDRMKVESAIILIAEFPDLGIRKKRFSMQAIALTVGSDDGGSVDCNQGKFLLCRHGVSVYLTLGLNRVLGLNRPSRTTSA